MTKITEFIETATRLPAPPALVAKLIKLINNPETQIEEIVSLFQTNPALSIRLLKLANSSFYGLRGEVQTVRRATILLGFKTIRSLAVAVWTHSLSTQFREEVLSEMLSTLFLHSAGCAVLGAAIAKRIAPDYQDDVFLAGLLHDVGKLALICEKSRDYKNMLDHLSADSTEDRVLQEIHMFGFGHDQLGAFLTETWGFPDFLIESSALHHQKNLNLETQPVPAMVTMANTLANAFFNNLGPPLKFTDELEEIWLILGLNKQEDIQDFTEKIKQDIQDMLGSMGV